MELADNTGGKTAALPGLAALLPHQGLQLVEEGLLILEVPVNRSESHIGYFVELAEALHQKFSYIYSRYLAVRGIAYLGLHLIHQFGELPHADRTLLAGLQEAA